MRVRRVRAVLVEEVAAPRAERQAAARVPAVLRRAEPRARAPAARAARAAPAAPAPHP